MGGWVVVGGYDVVGFGVEGSPVFGGVGGSGFGHLLAELDLVEGLGDPLGCVVLAGEAVEEEWLCCAGSNVEAWRVVVVEWASGHVFVGADLVGVGSHCGEVLEELGDGVDLLGLVGEWRVGGHGAFRAWVGYLKVIGVWAQGYWCVGVLVGWLAECG